jgi:hypothetical protein
MVGLGDGKPEDDGEPVQVTLSQRWIDSVSSNFEHLLWYITYESSNTATDSATGRRASARATTDGWMKDVKTNGRVHVEVPVGPVDGGARTGRVSSMHSVCVVT